MSIAAANTIKPNLKAARAAVIVSKSMSFGSIQVFLRVCFLGFAARVSIDPRLDCGCVRLEIQSDLLDKTVRNIRTMAGLPGSRNRRYSRTCGKLG
jgi:hypothetical protein